MLGMVKSTRTKSMVGSARNKDLSPSKVLAIVANWNNTSPEKESQRRKRQREEKLSASVPRSRKQRKSSPGDYLSLSSDDEEISSFKARSFYTSTGTMKYQSPLERRETLNRLIDAGIDPSTLNKSFDELQARRSRSQSLPVTPPAQLSNDSRKSRTNSIEKPTDLKGATSTDKRQSAVSKLSENFGQAKTMDKHLFTDRTGVKTSGEMSGVRGEIRVTLSERLPAGRARSSPRKSPRSSKLSPVTRVQRRTSPRKSATKATATKGIQMYVRNLKSGQKKKKKILRTHRSKRVSRENKGSTKDKHALVRKVKISAVELGENHVTDDQHTSSLTEKTARGLDFGVSEVNGHDLSPLEKSSEESNETNDVDNLTDFLTFHNEDMEKTGQETTDFVQNLLLEIDGDLEAAAASLKPSPRKRKMKMEMKKESTASPTSNKPPKTTSPIRRMSSTPVSSKKSRQPKLDGWLRPMRAQTSSPRRRKLEEIQSEEVKGQSTDLPTRASGTNSSPRVSPAKSPSQDIKLYPVFTPPTSPTVRNSPLSRKKQCTMGKVTPKKSPPLLKSLKSKNDNLEQMTLDLGQKRFGAVTCATCGTVYTAAHPEDETDHARFHKKYLSSIKFPGWKQEETLEEFHDGRIIVVTHDAPHFAKKKVEEIRALVDRELGFLEGIPMACQELCKTYLFISTDKKVGGCLIAEQITKGYRVIVEEPKPEGSITESQKAWCCETEPEPALCGVSRIWVPMTTRRRGIATRMMNCLRKNFMFGTILSPNAIAFSDPTPDGKLFATKYTGTPKFLVYKYH